VNSWPARPRTASGRPAFAEIAERELEPVYRYLALFTGDAALAEDLAAETFERAFRSWKRYDPRRAAPRTWLCRIARNVALDHFRAESRRRRREHAYALREEDEAREAVVHEGLDPELESALRSLSAGEREVLALRVLLGLDAPEAAAVLGISRTACSTRLSRALTKLEERMETNVVV
jgi:RNA polymerase sigma factor (sigma-70 family)